MKLTPALSLLCLLAGPLAASALPQHEGTSSGSGGNGLLYSGPLTILELTNPNDATQTAKAGCIDTFGFFGPGPRGCGRFELSTDGDQLLIYLVTAQGARKQCKLVSSGILLGLFLCEVTQRVEESFMVWGDGGRVRSAFPILRGDRELPGTERFAKLEGGNSRISYLQSSEEGAYAIWAGE
ncbi:MAG: hypothetical protein M1829_006364 [Trizodia sp. TS-e1964]|nr:MAG: hypothetical protein M1829_006364 [Trizodia sp. TS-e1964]